MLVVSVRLEVLPWVWQWRVEFLGPVPGLGVHLMLRFRRLRLRFLPLGLLDGYIQIDL